jgi:hypothetical protein
MASLSNRRAVAALVATGALLLTAFAVASAAEASTLYACVKKSGTARVFTKKPKCKKGESKVSWNSEATAGKNGTNGTDGANGTNGTNGTNGANGAVATYFASSESETALAHEVEEVTLGSKTVPAGDYLVTAKIDIGAEGSTAGAIGVKCQLVDGAVLDTNYLDAGLGTYGPGEFFSATPETLIGVLKSSSTSTIKIVCDWYFDVGSAEIVAYDWDIGAVQTTSIG